MAAREILTGYRKKKIIARTLMDWNKLPEEAMKSAFLATKPSLVQPNLTSKLDLL